MLAAVDFYVGPSKRSRSREIRHLPSTLRKQYLPRTVVAAGAAGGIALLQNRPMIDEKPQRISARISPANIR